MVLMRWSITFYETQTKQSDIFSIFSVICVRLFKQSINSTVTKTGWLCYQNVTKLIFASVRMCDCKRLSAHNFVDNLSSDNPIHQRGVVMSITVTISAIQSHTPDVTQTRCRTVAVHRRLGGSLCGRRPVHRCCRKPHGSLRSFSLTG